jgi:hypothetical protein
MTIEEAAATLIADMKKMESETPNDTEFGKAMRNIIRQMKEIDEFLEAELINDKKG